MKDGRMIHRVVTLFGLVTIVRVFSCPGKIVLRVINNLLETLAKLVLSFLSAVRRQAQAGSGTWKERARYTVICMVISE